MDNRFMDVCVVFVSCFILGAVGGCSGAPGEDGGSHTETINVGDGGDSVGGANDIGVTDGDSGFVTDPGSSAGDDGASSGEDVPDIVDYPEPGTALYWKDIIPGVWEQTDRENLWPYCTSRLEPETCKVSLTVEPITEEMQPACPGADWVIWADEHFSGAKALCLWDDGKVGFCLNNLSACGDMAEGTLTEEVVVAGQCSVKADGMPATCARHADCAAVEPSASCAGLTVRYWLDVCIWGTGFGATSCAEAKNERQVYMKIE